MNCPRCTNPENNIIRTEHEPKYDRRRHECLSCKHRWWGREREEPPPKRSHANSAVDPPLIARLRAITSASGGELYSESPIPSDPDLTSGSLSEGDRAPARSTGGAEFSRLTAVFSTRWQQSYNRPYPIVAADRNQLSRFMREHGNYIESFAAMCDRYLRDRRQFLMDRSGGHTLRWLVTSGLALYGGQPRESAEQYAARVRREHEMRKAKGALPPQSPEMRDLILQLADKKGA